MEERQRLGIQDALWLEMDRPNNLMVVDSVVWTAEPLDFAKVRAVVNERLINRYPVFRSLAVHDDDGSWWWEPDPDFDFDNHVSLISLHNPDDPKALQDLVAAHRNEMLDRNRPLWQAIWVKKYGPGSAMLLRSHHAIADGMRMVQLSMSLFDATPQGGPILAPAVTQHSAHPVPPGQPLARRARVTADRAVRTARSQASRLGAAGPELLRKAGRFGGFAMLNPVGAGDSLINAVRVAGKGLAKSMQSALPGVDSTRRPPTT